MDIIRKHYLDWLRDAHAMEEQALSMMRAMEGRLEDYPALRARIGEHILETERQARELRHLLEATDGGPSLLKDTLGKVTGASQAMSGLFATDEVVKGAMAGYTFEQMEIAAYRVLISAATLLGDRRAIAVFERNLAEELSMAEWLREHLDQTTRQFLARAQEAAPMGG